MDEGNRQISAVIFLCSLVTVYHVVYAYSLQFDFSNPISLFNRSTLQICISACVGFVDILPLAKNYGIIILGCSPWFI